MDQPVNGLLVLLQPEVSFPDGAVVPPLSLEPLVSFLIEQRRKFPDDFFTDPTALCMVLLARERFAAHTFSFLLIPKREQVDEKCRVDGVVSEIDRDSLLIAAQVVLI